MLIDVKQNLNSFRASDKRHINTNIELSIERMGHFVKDDIYFYFIHTKQFNIFQFVIFRAPYVLTIYFM